MSTFCSIQQKTKNIFHPSTIWLLERFAAKMRLLSNEFICHSPFGFAGKIHAKKIARNDIIHEQHFFLSLHFCNENDGCMHNIVYLLKLNWYSPLKDASNLVSSPLQCKYGQMKIKYFKILRTFVTGMTQILICHTNI